MSFESRFSEDEKFLLGNTPFAIGSTMAFSEGSGFGTIKELYSSTKTFIDGIKAYPENVIIEAIVPNMQSDEGKAKAKELQNSYKEWVKSQGVDSFDAMKKIVIRDAETVAKLLTDKARENESKEYKEWAMSIARNVANAAKEGGFLGFGGERISEKEREFYNQIATALDTTVDVL